MKTRPEDLPVINNWIFPALLGAPRFRPVSGPSTAMAYNEAAVFQALLSKLQPKCAIEIGTETGATLAIIARHSAQAISIDIDPQVRNLARELPNVEFITGSSHDVLPVLLNRLAETKVNPDFIFVDGDHSAAGVRRDIDHILNVRPIQQMIVLLHDSFNPGCRQGMLSANWSRNPYCHYVDLDFSPGILHPDESCLRQMWGGLGFALFLPEPRTHQLEVKGTHQLLFEAAYLQSVYCPRNRR